MKNLTITQQKPLSVSMGNDLFMRISYRTVSGALSFQDYALIDSAVITSDCDLIADAPVQMTTDAQKAVVKELFFKSSLFAYYSVFFDIDSLLQTDAINLAEYQSEMAWQAEHEVVGA